MKSSFVTQSRLGEWFGLTPRMVGDILIINGLKDRHGATQKAILGGYAMEACTRTGVTFFVWDASKVAPLIDGAFGGLLPTPYIDNLVDQYGESLADADRHRAEGDDLLADIILEHACAGVPPGLVGLLRERILHHRTIA